MGPPATTFPRHAPQQRKQPLRPAKPVTDLSVPPPGHHAPFIAGPTHDGLGAINAARLLAEQDPRLARAPEMAATAANAYRASQTAIYSV